MYARSHHRQPRRLVVALLLSLVATMLVAGLAEAGSSRSVPDARGFSTASIVNNQKRVCVYDHNDVDALPQFARVADRPVVDCAMVYTGASNWADWASPWFINRYAPADLDWAAWVRASPATDRRQLIISQPLIPTGLAGTNWLQVGARGGYTTYARELARNLVSAGVGDAVIRLSWEMNGNWNVDSIPDTTKGDREWVRFWRKTVLAMRSVRGAHFVFDWCPNNGYRPIALRDYYPGNDVVDIIGDDLYDTGLPGASNTQNWSFSYQRPDGLGAIIAFARAHHKPISIPEWAIAPRGSMRGGGDDQAFVHGMAQVVADNDVAFQTYFFRDGYASDLQAGRRARQAFRAAFGRRGYAVGPDDGTDVISTRVLDRGRRTRS